MVCLSVFPQRHSKSINRHIVTVYYYSYKTLFYRQLFHLFTKSKQTRKTTTVQRKEHFLISTDGYFTRQHLENVTFDNRYFLFCSTFVLSFMIAKLKKLFQTNNDDLN